MSDRVDGDDPLRSIYPPEIKELCIYDSSSSEDSVDSTDSYVQEGIGLQQLCNLRKIISGMCAVCQWRMWKNKIKNQAHLRWINSWPKGMGVEVPNGYHYLHTDGYFRKGRRGGYGVIIRNKLGKPIVASAVSVASTEVVSCRYHQLQGMTRGIELAIECSLLNIELFCNAKHVVRLVNSVLGTSNGCKFHLFNKENSFDAICKKCVMLYAKEDYHFVLPLLEKLEEMVPKLRQPFMIQKCPRHYNKAAYYLAKNGAPAGMEVLWPSKFPHGFKKILCKDHFGVNSMRRCHCFTKSSWLEDVLVGFRSMETRGHVSELSFAFML
ncbi:hypothetical protein MKW98_016607 [Papaver atlanticum]|uniref:RNase H type-1 domain-containing protein n=1 Tax=Papaver atlanticum TaxID=357466 RepID=A0AAD4SQY2_9MAGN|nr:hypothetical protein MKW98_016607 [Papaver atlanticum]